MKQVCCLSVRIDYFNVIISTYCESLIMHEIVTIVDKIFSCFIKYLVFCVFHKRAGIIEYVKCSKLLQSCSIWYNKAFIFQIFYVLKREKNHKFLLVLKWWIRLSVLWFYTAIGSIKRWRKKIDRTERY